MPKLPLLAALAGAAILATPTLASAQNAYSEVDLVSDIPGRAAAVDAHLVNPWGLAPGGSGVFWSSNNGTGTSTLYRPDGSTAPLVVQVPDGENTGIDVTLPNSIAFEIPSADTTARALFIFVSEAGTVTAWSNRVDPTHAITVATTPDAVYKGATIARSLAGPRLYATNFHAFRIDVFDHQFHPLTLPGSFTDPNLPAGYSPFNILNIDGLLVVAFAQKEPDGNDEVGGAGLGYVDVFDTDGNFLRRLVSQGALNAPWGLVLAPPTFGSFGGKLLVGNFGDGRINAYSLASGAWAGSLNDAHGDPIAIDGLWGLHFGLPVSGPEIANRLYFTAGLDEEAHGLFGYLAPVAGEVCADGGMDADDWNRECDRGKDLRGRHLPKHGVDADSLRALIACAAEFSRPFGAAGCYVASRDLLLSRGRMSERDQLARTFLALELDRCAGLVCDSTAVTCGVRFRDQDRDDHHDGDRWRHTGPGSNGHFGPVSFTVADIVALIDTSLCSVQSRDSLETMTGLAACAIRSGIGRHRDSDDAVATNPTPSISTIAPTLEVRALGGNPVRLAAGLGAQFVVTAPGAAAVRLDVYDAAGRLVAQPMRGSLVSGTSVIRWDGNDLRGVRVASGTYFYRAAAGSAVTSGHIVVVH